MAAVVLIRDYVVQLVATITEMSVTPSVVLAFCRSPRGLRPEAAGLQKNNNGTLVLTSTIIALVYYCVSVNAEIFW